MSGFFVDPYKFAQPPDPYWANVYLLLRGDGTVGANVVTDSSSVGNVPTGTGTGVTVQASPAKWGQSLNMNGVSTQSLFFYTTGSEWDLNQTAFTWEAWLYETPASGDALMSRRGIGGPRGWSLYTYLFAAVINGVWNDSQMNWAGSHPGPNVWFHFAFVKDGTELRAFINGTRVATKTGVNTIGNETTTPFIIGNGDYTTRAGTYVGNIEEMRYTRGVARYNANFTPPTQPFPNY